MSHRLLAPVLVAVFSTVAAVGCAAPEEVEDADSESEDVTSIQEALVPLEYDLASCCRERFRLNPRVEGRLADGSLYAAGGFISSGDYFQLVDHRSDGRSVGLHWRVLRRDGTVLRRGICRATVGKLLADSYCNKDLPEGYDLEVRIGRCDGTRYSCQTMTGWTNWSPWRRGST